MSVPDLGHAAAVATATTAAAGGILACAGSSGAVAGLTLALGPGAAQ